MEKVATLHAFDLETFCKAHKIEIPTVKNHISTFRRIADATWAKLSEIPNKEIINDR